MNSKQNINIKLDSEVLSEKSKYYDGEDLTIDSLQEIEEFYDMFKTTNKEYYDLFLYEITYDTEEKLSEIMNVLLTIAPIHSFVNIDS